MATFDPAGSRRPAKANRPATAALVVLGVLATMTGCASPSSGSAGTTGPAGAAASGAASGTQTGTVTGSVRTYGGPQLGGAAAANGRPNVAVVLRFERDGKLTGSATTDSTGMFTVTLPAGDYSVDACGWGKATDHVVVTAGSRQTREFRCEVP